MIGKRIVILEPACSINTDVPAASIIKIDRRHGDYPCGVIIESPDPSIVGKRLDAIHRRYAVLADPDDISNDEPEIDVQKMKMKVSWTRMPHTSEESFLRLTGKPEKAGQGQCLVQLQDRIHPVRANYTAYDGVIISLFSVDKSTENLLELVDIETKFAFETCFDVTSSLFPQDAGDWAAE